MTLLYDRVFSFSMKYMKKTDSQKLFLDVLSCALRNEKMKENYASSECWMEVFHLAEMHHVLPMIVHASSGVLNQNESWVSDAKRKVRQIVMKQTLQNECLFHVLDHLKEAGFHVLVVKGLCCRQVYPVSDLRISSDEDFLVKSDEFEAVCKELTKLGAVCQNEDINCDEVTFVLSELTIELHRTLFPTNSVYAHLNEMFAGAFERYECLSVSGHEVLCMHPEDHWLYLAMHAYKHFLHGGSGVRQLCDLMMFKKAYEHQIDWNRVFQKCRDVQIDQLVCAWMKLSNEVLNNDDHWFANRCDLDVSDLLEDMLKSGVYGSSSLTRRHTASLTLNAADGKNSGTSLMKSLFPPVSALKTRYAFLDKAPLLLPVAWLMRWGKYAAEVCLKKESSVKETLTLASKRKALIKKYRGDK